MSNQDDLWLWFVDDAPLQALLKAEGIVGSAPVHAAASPQLVGALSAQMAGRTEEAVRELESLIDSGEAEPEAFLFLGQIHFEAGRFQEAAGVYEKLVGLAPGYAVGVYNLAVCKEKLSGWSDAADMFQKAVNLDPDRREAWMGLGLSCLHQSRADEALAAFERYLEIDPENDAALFGRAVCLQMLKRFEEASAIYERFLEGREPSPEFLTNFLSLAIARKDLEGLAKLASLLESFRPGSVQALEAQAYVAFLAENWDLAVAALNRLADAGPLSPEWAYARAQALWRAGLIGEAGRQVDALLTRDPHHRDALLLRGLLFEDLGEMEDAVAAYRKAVDVIPDAEDAGWNLVRLIASQGKAEPCRKLSRTLLERNPASPEGWFTEGVSALLDRRPNDAAAAFSEALRIRPRWPEAEWNLGLSLLDSGDPAKAERALEHAYDQLGGKVPADPIVRAALETGRLDLALTLFDAAADSIAAPELVFNLAVAVHHQGKLREAERLYRRVIECGVSFADAHVNLGHVLLATGRPDEAEAVWEAARQMETVTA